jgi:hypothetical protein
MTTTDDDLLVTVPADLIEDIHYHLTCFDKATSQTNAGHHLIELWNKVGDLTSWHPGFDANSGTLPWERGDDE